MTETRLEIARRKGDLAGAIGALRENARAETASAEEPIREQVDIVDSAIQRDPCRRRTIRDRHQGRRTPSGNQ
jgi:hypothetical protein